MKTRILAGLAMVAVLVGTMATLDTPVLNVLAAFLSFMAIRELFTAAGLRRFSAFMVPAAAQACLLPFLRVQAVRGFLVPFYLVLLLWHFVFFVVRFGDITVEQCAVSLLFGTLVPVFFTCAVLLRDEHGVLKGGYYLILALGSGFLADTGAYFTGTFFGRRPLAPRVSPKKTVEGALGGLVTNSVVLLILSAVYLRVLAGLGIDAWVNYAVLFPLSILFAAVGILGDLTASAIKRQYGVKDFGKLIPGHGGILDRFDSVLFTLPAVYAVVRCIDLFMLR